MPGQQQDYILREIELLGRYVARLRRKGKALDEKEQAELNETLLLAMHLQERNFGMPAAKFLGMTADEQVTALRKGESKAGGHERCLVYAAILKAMAELYAYRNREDLTLGARQLALYVVLSVAVDQPADAPAVQALVHELRSALGDVALHPPTGELLDQFARSPSA
jgi:hypothetical protein